MILIVLVVMIVIVIAVIIVIAIILVRTSGSLQTVYSLIACSMGE